MLPTCANNCKTPLTQVAKLEDPNLKQDRNLNYPWYSDNAAGAKVVEMQTPGLTGADYAIFLRPLLWDCRKVFEMQLEQRYSKCRLKGFIWDYCAMFLSPSLWDCRKVLWDRRKTQTPARESLFWTNTTVFFLSLWDRRKVLWDRFPLSN